MSSPSAASFSCLPDPENPGWHRWLLADVTRFNEVVLGRILVRVEGDALCRVRMIPGHIHSNSAGNIHGGVTMAFSDVALFATAFMLRDIDATHSATLDLTTQFIGGGDVSRPLDAKVDLLRETGRLCFLRGLMVQDDDVVSSFSGTIRKPSTPR